MNFQDRQCTQAPDEDLDTLKSVSSLPNCFQSLFSFRYFNSVQSTCFREVYHTNANVVVSAPTGSGKTVLFELAILRMLQDSVGQDGSFHVLSGRKKAVYIAPMKALVQEKHREWAAKFGSGLHLSCQELTGDSNISNLKSLQEADLVLTTPEKFDSITRRYKDHGGTSFFGDIALLLIDEVHLLNDPRGASLEAIVSRLKMLARYPELASCPIASIRFIAVSATIPNLYDIGEWLKVPQQGLKWFGEETRPVKLTTKVLGYAPAKNDFLFEKRLQNYLYDIISQHSMGKPSLVFCATRKGSIDAAFTLAQEVGRPGSANPFVRSRDQAERLQRAVLTIQDKQLQTCLVSGVGFHSGGVNLNDRALVESLFLRGDLQVICTTSTLAHGVNLPAHLVVVKSTQFYNQERGGYVEYDRSTLLQMAGRAGRPQFDDSGTVVIMTQKSTAPLYQNLLAGAEPVESCLLPCLAEHLNAEIVLLTVSDVSLAIDWLKDSYLFVRMKQNPQHYSVPKFLSPDQLEKKLKGICLAYVKELAQFGMISMDDDGFVLKPEEPGVLMAKYYLSFNTMKALANAPDNSDIEDLLWVLAKAQELSWIRLRRSEKKLLKEINSETGGRIKYHVMADNGKLKKLIQTDQEKIFVLANDALSGEPSTLDFTMTQDTSGICSTGERLGKCMSNYFAYKKQLKATVASLVLTNCMRQRVWEDSPFLLKQLEKIGPVTAKAFVNGGITTFEQLEKADPRRIETLTGRKYPFGNQLKESLHGLPPRVSLEIHLSGRYVIGQNEFTLTLTRLRNSNASSQRRHYATLVAGSEHDNRLLVKELVRLNEFASPLTVTFLAKRAPSGAPAKIIAQIIPEEFVGCDVKKVFGHDETSRTNKNSPPKNPLQHQGADQGGIPCVQNSDDFQAFHYSGHTGRDGLKNCPPPLLTPEPMLDQVCDRRTVPGTCTTNRGVENDEDDEMPNYELFPESGAAAGEKQSAQVRSVESTGNGGTGKGWKKALWRKPIVVESASKAISEAHPEDSNRSSCGQDLFDLVRQKRQRLGQQAALTPNWSSAATPYIPEGSIVGESQTEPTWQKTVLKAPVGGVEGPQVSVQGAAVSFASQVSRFTPSPNGRVSPSPLDRASPAPLNHIHPHGNLERWVSPPFPSHEYTRGKSSGGPPSRVGGPSTVGSDPAVGHETSPYSTLTRDHLGSAGLPAPASMRFSVGSVSGLSGSGFRRSVDSGAASVLFPSLGTSAATKLQPDTRDSVGPEVAPGPAGTSNQPGPVTSPYMAWPCGASWSAPTSSLLQPSTVTVSPAGRSGPSGGWSDRLTGQGYMSEGKPAGLLDFPGMIPADTPDALLGRGLWPQSGQLKLIDPSRNFTQGEQGGNTEAMGGQPVEKKTIRPSFPSAITRLWQLNRSSTPEGPTLRSPAVSALTVDRITHQRTPPTDLDQPVSMSSWKILQDRTNIMVPPTISSMTPCTISKPMLCHSAIAAGKLKPSHLFTTIASIRERQVSEPEIGTLVGMGDSKQSARGTAGVRIAFQCPESKAPAATIQSFGGLEATADMARHLRSTLVNGSSTERNAPPASQKGEGHEVETNRETFLKYNSIFSFL